MIIQTDFYTITPYKNLLFIEFFLSWDNRVAKKCIEEVCDLASKLFQNKPWAILSNRKNWQLNTPYAELFFTLESTNKEFVKSLTHSAIVTGKSNVNKWQINKMIKDVRDYKVRVFDNIQEAQIWLASFGYHML
jgi:hypothetical protein